ncbi:hypothetical protein HanHA300_Chr11g0407311 [Helianthus annuus]|nr:hypothetical protein HanHA300_Chr11g0407311 [Helianthus annuus]KAJ0509923.1 hypothetical protein HanIR_Chr11g0534661 [Helianthus annuus]KAJ0517905.1 hypothetical protein HanHA89_Chr11g0431051 [Helianthus annuus]KAJ0685922.1 hypothetical protein HanLR1_Chr11g0408561 [Helianthus annuus]
MEIRVPSRRSLFRSLSLLLPLCNEDTGPVTPALIFRGVTQIASKPRLVLGSLVNRSIVICSHFQTGISNG